jgi:hypothetical protein
MARRYRWAPERIKGAILPLADYVGYTSEVFYPDIANHREVTVVWVIRQPAGLYEIREEKRAARLAATPGVRYTSRVRTTKAAPVRKPIKEAPDMATTRAPRGKAAAKKAAPEPEPEDELEEELEEEELEDEEDLEDEAEGDEEPDEDEDEEDEEVEDEADEDDEAKDYTPYAGKSPTPTMTDFSDWLLAEVYGDDLPEGFDEDTFREGVRLGGTLRMEFQRSDFCRERREERKMAAAKAAAKPAKTTKAAKAEPETPAKPAKPSKPTAAKPTAKPTAAAKPTAKRAVPGKPAGRAADRPATATKAPARGRRGKTAAAEEPF